VLVEIKNLSNKIYDICILGAGPAGITLALNLSKNFNIALIEGGDFNFSDKSQNIYKGKNIGDKYFELDETRLRLFGGSSNHWGGMCRSLDDFEFIKKNYSKLANWSLNKKDLDLYLDKACEILEIQNNFFSKKINNKINEINFQFSKPVNFNTKYKDEILKSKNIDLFINTNAQFLKPKNKIHSVSIKNFKNEEFLINSKKFIICLGGIETSRFLLLSKFKNNSFLKNNNNIGKYWMEHPHFVVGDVILKEQKDYAKKPASYEEMKYFTLNDNLKLEKKILNCSIRLDKFQNNPYQRDKLKKMIHDLSCVAPKLSKKMFDLFDKNLLCGGRIIAVSEQEPNENSKIVLDRNSVDRFNLPRVNLNWKKNRQDLKTLRVTAEEFAKDFAKNNYGRIAIQNWLYSENFTENENFLAGNHHMGGCRMSSNSKNGLVDNNLELHDFKNVYICGSSVFPSAGHSNPTLTIIQLSLKLASKINSAQL